MSGMMRSRGADDHAGRQEPRTGWRACAGTAAR
jgi:hypothetical protein